MKKAVVIGSGIGGLGLAALLQNTKQYDVTVLERNAFSGGKAHSYERDGFVFDMGVHYCALGDKGPLKKLARKVGTDITFITKNPFMKLQEGRLGFHFGASFKNPVSLVKMGILTRANPLNVFGCFRLLLKILSVKGEQDVIPYDEIPLRDFLNSYTRDQGVHKFLDTFGAMLFVIPAEEASAGEFLYSFGAMAQAGSLCYPKGAFRAIPQAYRSALERGGGRVLLKETVTGIQVEKNRAVGVKTESGFFPADLVVSNAGIRKTLDFAQEDNFPADYVKKVRALKDSAGSVTLKLGLDKCPHPIPLYMYCPKDGQLSERMHDLERGIVPEDPHMFMPMTTVSDPGLAPPGKHILIAGSMVPADFSAKKAAEKTLDNMETRLEKLFPGIEKHILFKHRTNLDYVNRMGGRGAGEVIGLAQTYTQVGKNKPDPKTPVDNLWLVGTDAGGRGVGTEQAADSALKVFEKINLFYSD